MNARVSAYLRVSTNAQDTENQLHGVELYAAAAGIRLNDVIHDTASGSTHWKKRPIAQLVGDAQPGDIMLVSEISRLARSTLQVLEIMKTAAEAGMTIHVVKSRLIMDGSMSSRIIATVLGLAAEIEREFIAARTKESLARRRDSGLPMGRPTGAAKTLKLDAKAAEIDRYIGLKINKRAIAKLLDCQPSTLYAWLKRRRAPQD